jgi:hypothetical protein
VLAGLLRETTPPGGTGFFGGVGDNAPTTSVRAAFGVNPSRLVGHLKTHPDMWTFPKCYADDVSQLLFVSERRRFVA